MFLSMICEIGVRDFRFMFMVGLERYIRYLTPELTCFSVSAAGLELARRNLTPELIYFCFFVVGLL